MALSQKKRIKKDGMENNHLNTLTEKAIKISMDKTVVRKVLKQLFGRYGTEKLSWATPNCGVSRLE